MRRYTLRDLDDAERRAARAVHDNSEEAAYDVARHAAMAAAFGVDPSQTIDLDGHLAGLADQFGRWRANLESPFSSYLEAPASIIELYQHYGQDINAQVDQLARTVDALLADVRGRVATVAPGVMVSDDDLRAHGFEPNDGGMQ